ncbi:cyanobactin maturation protease PatG family protein [Saccharopolyspora sp. NPDC002376]
MSGQVIPVVGTEQRRGVLGWDVGRLIDEATTAALRTQEAEKPTEDQEADITDDAAKKTEEEKEKKKKEEIHNLLRDFLNRIYYDLRNLGTTSQDRALNAAATYAFQSATALSEAVQEGKSLDTIEVEKSPFGRMDSDSWDIKLRFFDPKNNKVAKRVWRYTIDVSDLVPVPVGEPRTWQEA